MSLSLAEKLALWKYLDAALSALHKKDLVPTAQDQMVPTQREPVKFGGRLAGWVTLPKPRQGSAYIKDAAKLLAWAKVNYPAKVENPVEVKLDAGLIEFLQEHRPQSLHVAERVDPQWTDDIRGALTEQGYYITATGEKLTEVPGIEVPEPVALVAAGAPGEGRRRDHRRGVARDPARPARGAGASRTTGGQRCLLREPARAR